MGCPVKDSVTAYDDAALAASVARLFPNVDTDNQPLFPVSA